MKTCNFLKSKSSKKDDKKEKGEEDEKEEDDDDDIEVNRYLIDVWCFFLVLLLIIVNYFDRWCKGFSKVY